jgi:hypothetical protein
MGYRYDLVSGVFGQVLSTDGKARNERTMKLLCKKAQPARPIQLQSLAQRASSSWSSSLSA